MGNTTKIKFIKVLDKIYQVVNISFFHMRLEAAETKLTIEEVAEDELFDVMDFKNYSLKLINNNGCAEMIDFEKWKSGR